MCIPVQKTKQKYLTEGPPEYIESTLPVLLSFMTFCVTQIILVELHLDDDLEVLLVVGLKCPF